MATQEEHHEELIRGLAQQMKPILDKSPQAIYLYLDDNHKTCNKSFASLVGYTSVKAWEQVDAPLADVAKASQPRVVAAYGRASENMEASSLRLTMKNVRTGELIKANMIMVPVTYQGHVIVLHFLSRL